MNRNTDEASQPLESSATTSDTTAIEEIRQAIRAEFAKGLKSLGINLDLHKLDLGLPTTDATSDTVTHSHSVIDLCNPPSVPPIFSSPISMASTPSNAENAGNGDNTTVDCHPSIASMEFHEVGYGICNIGNQYGYWGSS